jgi:hypothetical protein
MTFLELMQALERRLGSHQLPLRAQARGLSDLIEDGALHPDLMRRLSRDLYVANRCRQLSDTVSPDLTLDILGSIRFEILESPASDVDLCHAIEEFCAVVTALLNQDQAAAGAAPPPAVASARGARVIPLDPARRTARVRRDRA